MKNINCYEFQSFCKEMKRFILNFCFNFEYIKKIDMKIIIKYDDI